MARIIGNNFCTVDDIIYSCVCSAADKYGGAYVREAEAGRTDGRTDAETKLMRADIA